MSIITRPLTINDETQIKHLDELNPLSQIFNFIQDMLEEANDDHTHQDYAYGIFYDNILIGYATIGGAEEIEEAKDDADAELLGDVFVLDEYQNKGYGSTLIKYIIKEHNYSNIYGDILDTNLMNFYEPLGFELLTNDFGGIIKRNKD